MVKQDRVKRDLEAGARQLKDRERWKAQEKRLLHGQFPYKQAKPHSGALDLYQLIDFPKEEAARKVRELKGKGKEIVVASGEEGEFFKIYYRDPVTTGEKQRKQAKMIARGRKKEEKKKKKEKKGEGIREGIRNVGKVAIRTVKEKERSKSRTKSGKVIKAGSSRSGSIETRGGRGHIRL